MKKKIFLWLCIAGGLVLTAAAQERYTENTLRLDPEKPSPAATLSDMAWLAGHWTGPAMGGFCEEIWSGPSGGAMIGMFRFIRNDKTVFYELMTIRAEEDTIILQLKHFGPQLKGWEEKDKTIDFRFVARKDEAVYFEGMTFKRENENSVAIYLAAKQKDGTLKEEVFRYRRAASTGK